MARYLPLPAESAKQPAFGRTIQRAMGGCQPRELRAVFAGGLPAPARQARKGMERQAGRMGYADAGGGVVCGASARVAVLTPAERSGDARLPGKFRPLVGFGGKQGFVTGWTAVPRNHPAYPLTPG